MSPQDRKAGDGPALLIGEFGLQKKICARDEACAIGGSQSFTNSGFKVVAALVGGVDGAKAGADGEFGQGAVRSSFQAVP